MPITSRYPTILTMVFVTFTHGCALPVLFPICWLGITILYLLETGLMAHFYVYPPTDDTFLSNKALSHLMFAPITMMFMAYWQLGNRQAFFSEVEVKEYARETTSPGHDIF